MLHRVDTYIMKWVALISLLLLTSSALPGCIACVNGRGIGCGNVPDIPTYPGRPAAAKPVKSKSDTELARQINQSFFVKLARAAGVEDSPGSDQLIQLESRKEKAAVAGLLAQVLGEMERSARKHNEQEQFRTYFSFPERLTTPKLSIVDRGIAPTANCMSGTIQVPRPFIQALFDGSFTYSAHRIISTPAIPEGPFYPGTIIKSIPSSPAATFAESTALMNTATYRTAAFVLAHEAAHLWSSTCVPSDDPAVQRKREADADLFATIVASELYAGKCMDRPLLLSEATIVEMTGGGVATHDDIGQLVADRMNDMELERFLVAGGGDVKFMFDSMKDKVNPNDPNHPPPGVRVSVDAKMRRLIVREFYNDMYARMKSSLMIRMLVPKEQRDVVHEGLKAGTVGTVYSEYLSDELLKCGVVRFRPTVMSRSE